MTRAIELCVWARGRTVCLSTDWLTLCARPGTTSMWSTSRWGGDFRAEVATSFDLYRRLSHCTRAAIDAGTYPLVLAGNCGSALGTVSGAGSEEMGIIWFDAYGDFTTPETSTRGFLDGMGLAVLAGTCWQPLASTVPGFRPVPAGRILHIGARDLDRGEGERMRQAGVTLVEAGSIEHAEIHAVLEPALSNLCARVSEVYVHVDADVFDPTVAPANTYQPKGGLTVQQIEEALDAIGRVLCIRAAGVAAYDPACDPTG